jgi:glutathione S-transferase
VLRESMAISRYLEEQFPEPNLLGVDTWERAQIEQWNRHAELELLFPIGQVFRNTHAFWQGRIKQAPEFGEIMREHVAARFEWLDQELGGRPYLAGDRFTVADITALCAIDFGRVSNIRIDPAAQPNLAAWHARVSARPSAKA